MLTALAWLAILVLSGVLVYLRLRRDRTWIGVEPRIRHVLRGSKEADAQGVPGSSEPATRRATVLNAYLEHRARQEEGAHDAPDLLRLLSDRAVLVHDATPSSPVAIFLAETFEQRVPVTLRWPGGRLTGRIGDLPDPETIDFLPLSGNWIPGPTRGRPVELFVKGGGCVMQGYADVVETSHRQHWRLAMPRRLERLELRRDLPRLSVRDVSVDLKVRDQADLVRWDVVDVSARGLRVAGGHHSRLLQRGEYLRGVVRLQGSPWSSVHVQVRNLDRSTGQLGAEVLGAAERVELRALCTGLQAAVPS